MDSWIEKEVNTKLKERGLITINFNDMSKNIREAIEEAYTMGYNRGEDTGYENGYESAQSMYE